MEGNSWRPAQGDPTSAAADWRGQLQHEERQRVVDQIMETLKRYLPISVPEGLNELHKIAVRFEDKIYSAATSQADYLEKISLKMLSMESKAHPAPTINSRMSAGAVQTQNPGDPALSIAPQVSIQTQSLLQPHIQQQQQQSLLQPNPLQYLQQSVMQMSSDLQQLQLTAMPQNQLNSIQQPVSSLRQQQQVQSTMHQQNSIQQHSAQSDLQEVSYSTSMESTAQTGPAGGVDWQEEIYQKIISMKELYYADLSELYHRIVMKLQQHDALIPPGELSEQYDKMKNFKIMLERTLAILKLNKVNIQFGLKDKLPLYEKQIVSILASHKKKPPQPQGPQQQSR